jgi:hypothetical protein
MDYLFEFSNREEVRSITQRAMRSPSVQGVVVDLDRLWLHSWEVYNSMTESEFQRYDRSLSGLLFSPWQEFGPRTILVDLQRLTPPWLEDIEWGLLPSGIDINFRPGFWVDLNHALGREPTPFVVRVIRRPGPSERDELNTLEPEGFRLIFETRPVAYGYARSTDRVRPLVGGLSVGPAKSAPGTLGGILRSDSSTYYGLTCSHVLLEGEKVHQPSPVDKKYVNSEIGACVASTVLDPAAGPCSYDADSNTMDAALIEIDPNVASQLSILTIGALSGISSLSNVHTGLMVQMVGKQSGDQRLRVGGLAVSMEIDIGGVKHCFANLFELRRLSSRYGLTATFAPPAREGDSGAWVIRPGPNGPEWCGMVVGGDGIVAYAILASAINDWLTSEKYGGLSVA